MLPKTFIKQAMASSSNTCFRIPKLVMIDSTDIVCPSDSLKKVQDENVPNCHIRLYEVVGKSDEK